MAVIYELSNVLEKQEEIHEYRKENNLVDDVVYGNSQYAETVLLG